MKNMIGKVFTKVTGSVGDDVMVFENNIERFTFYHYQNCCESVSIEDIVGDLSDLVGEPLLIADEVDGETPNSNNFYESCTWTFYKFATCKGYVDVRWFGASNGYYSESVDMKHEVFGETH